VGISQLQADSKVDGRASLQSEPIVNEVAGRQKPGHSYTYTQPVAQRRPSTTCTTARWRRRPVTAQDLTPLVYTFLYDNTACLADDGST